MNGMPAFALFRPYIRVVLAWYVLFLTAAIASPMVHAKPLEIVCSASGQMKVVEAGDQSQPLTPHQGLACFLCLATAACLPCANSSFSLIPPPFEHRAWPVTSTNLVNLTAPPLPSRGPPNAH